MAEPCCAGAISLRTLPARDLGVRPSVNEFPARDLAYVIRLDEILWGGLLLALTVVVHGVGLLTALHVLRAPKERVGTVRSPSAWLAIIILAVWIIVAVSLVEVGLWAAFFVWRGAQPNIFSAFYHALLNYATLQAGYLPVRWRLLEGMLGMAGLISFAWSTGILASLAHNLVLAVRAERTPQAGGAVSEQVDGRDP